ncbi:hypothetical protein [Klebsiella variicola]|uniref:hypothetical protein n=1 Tax=Klebsiella variicola TaxID=244366 RepID=UPI000E2CD0DA|nr:hypothetical protein [Klebsiella variicola]SXE11719.1 Uncharacterised protein [Klebsiella variicola]
MAQITDERLVKILSETQATIMEHNSRCVRGSVEVDARLFESMIMELQVRRKIDYPPVHPTVASETLDDETLQELIEFRRTTFEYHSKEGNKVQTIIHGVTLSALRELQERRKAAMDSEPVAWRWRWSDDAEGYWRYTEEQHETRGSVTAQPLYRHAQPAPVVPDDYVMVPKEPTESMVIAGFESEPYEFFSEPDVWEAFQKMSGCEQAAFRARLCWAAMLAAAPQKVK